MAGKSSPLAIYAAVGGNHAIAIMKFVAAAFTGSSSMFSVGYIRSSIPATAACSC